MSALFAPVKFPAGAITATSGALHAADPVQLMTCLGWHQAGIWGEVCDEDAAANHRAITEGGRILSAYPIDPALPCKGWGENTLWIITEADRSVTTFLLPEEY